MPGSAPPEPDAPPPADLDLGVVERLEKAVGRLIVSATELRVRAERAEAACERLRASLAAEEGSSAESDEDVEDRLERLAHDNQRLRTTLEAAREHAERIRSQLMVVEDEL